MHKNLRYLFVKFLKIGATSWGGYMALIAMIEKQICERDQAIEEEKIVHAISLASVLPGPTAVNVVAYVGYQLNGIKGALVSMIAVLIPCFILMVVLSYVYFSYGNVPAFNNFFAGITPAIAALLISVAFTMGKKNIKDAVQIILAVLALLSVLFIHSAYTTILVILISGIAGYIIYTKKLTSPLQQTSTVSISKKSLYRPAIGIAVLIIVLAIVYSMFKQYPVVELYKQMLITFSGLSISQFGGGYVVIPTMQKVIVDSLHWLTGKEFTDAIAMGQITPGPIYISAPFIGYKLSGIAGALVSTMAMFLPAACVMLLCAKFMDAIITSPVVKACFKGITPAVAGMIAATGCSILYKEQNMSVLLGGILVISLILFIKFKMNPVYVIPLAGISGLLIF